MRSRYGSHTELPHRLDRILTAQCVQLVFFLAVVGAVVWTITWMFPSSLHGSVPPSSNGVSSTPVPATASGSSSSSSSSSCGSCTRSSTQPSPSLQLAKSEVLHSPVQLGRYWKKILKSCNKACQPAPKDLEDNRIAEVLDLHFNCVEECVYKTGADAIKMPASKRATFPGKKNKEDRRHSNGNGGSKLDPTTEPVRPSVLHPPPPSPS